MPFPLLPSPELRQFAAEVKELLKPHNPQSISLFYFITQKLRQFRLDTIYSESDILNEAYLRGVVLTTSGTAIQRPCAWLRSTTHNVIREHNRSQRRAHSIEFDGLTEPEQAKIEREHLEITASNPLMPDEVFGVHLESVVETWQVLQPLDRKIIQLRSIDGLSWREVAEKILAEDEVPYTETALRKRFQRTLERFRKHQYQQH